MSCCDFFIKQNDLKPAIATTLTNSNGTPIVLTGATVRFRMRPLLGTTPKVNAAATITNAAAGQVSYQWVNGDTDTVGAFLVEWLVTLPGGAEQTVPNASYNQVRVSPRLF